MSEKIKIKITPAVAAYVKPGTSSGTRLSGCSAAAGLPPFERVTLLFCLSKDPEGPIKSAALEQLGMLPKEVVAAYSASLDANPAVLETLSRIASARSTVPDIPASRSDHSEQTGEVESPEKESEESVSKYKMAQTMGMAEKIKMALTGDKEWRSILVRDANKLVSGGVIKNPRITEAEVLALVKSGIQNDEIMRLICANREWIKDYNLRKALIMNNRTPVQNSIRYLETMGEKDLASIAKSKNVSSVISTMAKRILLNKKK